MVKDSSDSRDKQRLKWEKYIESRSERRGWMVENSKTFMKEKGKNGIGYMVYTTEGILGVTTSAWD